MAHFTDEQLIALLKLHRNTQEIADALNTSRRSVQRRIKVLQHRGYIPEQGLVRPLPEGFVVGKVTVQANALGEVERTWTRFSPDEQLRLEAMQHATQALLAEMPSVCAVPAPSDTREDLLVAYPIGDPHVGMYAWAAETGEDWDLKIAERVHCDAMHTLVQAAPKASKAVIINLGDLFHYDSQEAKTPRSGHYLNADGRYAKMIWVGVMILRRCINSALERHASVHVINVQGNHDETGAQWLSVALALAYEHEPRVTVDMSPKLFNYVRFGKVLLGAHHGHSCKAEKLPGVMAADESKAWGETEFRHWFIGHIHHESKKEFAGCSVESFNTLAAKDAYAMNGGWRSDRVMQAIAFHKDFGEVARSRVNVKMLEK